jgi:hypothetical protein
MEFRRHVTSSEEMHPRQLLQRGSPHPLAPAGDHRLSRRLHIASETVAIEAERIAGRLSQLRQTLPQLVDRALIAAPHGVVKPDTDLNDPLDKPLGGGWRKLMPVMLEMLMRLEEEPH